MIRVIAPSGAGSGLEMIRELLKEWAGNSIRMGFSRRDSVLRRCPKGFFLLMWIFRLVSESRELQLPSRHLGV